MRESRRTEILTAGVLVAPFVAIYGWLFVYPTIQMVRLSFTDAPLIGAGNWIGLDNYSQLFKDRVFGTAVWNTLYFVVLTVVPGTAAALSIALMVSRLRGWTQSIILAAFFLPYVLPVTVVYVIWDWMFNVQYGVLQYILTPIMGQPVNVWRRLPWRLIMLRNSTRKSQSSRPKPRKSSAESVSARRTSPGIRSLLLVTPIK